MAVIIYRIQPGRAPQLFVKRNRQRIRIRIRGLCDALEGNVNDRSLIAELELSKKYEVVEGSPCDGGHSCPIEGERNID
jgi:hypothetical protein